MNKYVRLAGSSSVLPGKPIKFEDINNYLGKLERAPEKLRKWMDRIQPVMKEMLGIEYCHYAFNSVTRNFDEDNVTMSVRAAQDALAESGIKACDIDLIVYGGAYSQQIPPISTVIQDKLGIEICGEFHVHANCTSAYKAIKIAHALLKSGEYRNAIVVSSIVASSCFIPEFYNQEKITKEDIFLRWYLCDGAGAFVLSADDTRKRGFYLDNVYVESAGGLKRSAMHNDHKNQWNNPLDDYKDCRHHIRQIYISELKDAALEANGKTIFYNALKRMIDANKIDLTRLKKFVVNMPSKAVREYITTECAGLGISLDKFYSAIGEIGYAGPPAAIISMDRLIKSGSFEEGDMLFSFVMEVSKYMQAGFSLVYNA